MAVSWMGNYTGRSVYQVLPEVLTAGYHIHTTPCKAAHPTFDAHKIGALCGKGGDCSSDNVPLNLQLRRHLIRRYNFPNGRLVLEKLSFSKSAASRAYPFLPTFGYINRVRYLPGRPVANGQFRKSRVNFDPAGKMSKARKRFKFELYKCGWAAEIRDVKYGGG